MQYFILVLPLGGLLAGCIYARHIVSHLDPNQVKTEGVGYVAARFWWLFVGIGLASLLVIWAISTWVPLLHNPIAMGIGGIVLAETAYRLSYEIPLSKKFSEQDSSNN